MPQEDETAAMYATVTKPDGTIINHTGVTLPDGTRMTTEEYQEREAREDKEFGDRMREETNRKKPK